MIINWCKVGAALERSFLPVLGFLVLILILIFSMVRFTFYLCRSMGAVHVACANHACSHD
jgi:hypothetical protein